MVQDRLGGATIWVTPTLESYVYIGIGTALLIIIILIILL
jgi:hypothetical protein